jgi:acetate kinase
LLDELRRITPYDSEHLPLEIELIEAIRQRYPALPQVACFDTAFHRAMPRVASQLPIPRRYEAAGIRRYGFHGRSPTRHKGMSSEQGAITASAHLDQLGEICFPRPTPGG